MAKLTGKNALICGDARTIKVTAPFNLTGYTLIFTVKSPTNLSVASDAGAPIQVTLVCPATADTIAGIAYIALTAAATRIAAGKYVFDVQFNAPSGSKVSSPRQDIEFVEDVTKS